MPYTVLSHTADTGIEATAGSLAELVEELATGMSSLLADSPMPATDHMVEVEVESASREDLVVDVLSDLLYRSEVDGVLLTEFTVTTADPHRARVTARTVPLAEVELTGPPIKAVTYHDLTVEETETGWLGRVYFDV